MKILIACEESQRVCVEMRKLGHEAYSCDIQEPSGAHPEWHILGDVLEILNPIESFCLGKVRKAIAFTTMDNVPHVILDKWDMIIAHPPCTYLSNVATRHHSLRCTSLDKINDRTLKRIEAMQFFMNFANADCDRIAIENPVGVMNTCYRKPDQIIHPYFFAENENDTENYVTKATCLWLKGIKPLRHTDPPKPDNKKLFGVKPSGKAKTWEESVSRAGGAAKARSKTFPGIARAMAEQWAGQAQESTANYKEDFMRNNYLEAFKGTELEGLLLDEQ